MSKNPEEQMSQLEGNYRMIFDSIKVGIVQFDLNGIVTDCNRYFLKIPGSSREKVIGLNLLDPSHDVSIKSAVLKALSGRSCHYEECCLPISEVGPVRVTIRCDVMKSRDGEVLGGLGVFESVYEEPFVKQSQLELVVAEQMTELRKTNQLLQLEISDRKRAYKALEASNRKLQDIIDFLPDATFVIDDRRRVIAWNRSMEAMTGVSKETMLGKSNFEYAVPFYGKKRPILIDIVLDPMIPPNGWYHSIEREGNVIRAEAFVSKLNNGLGAHLWGTASVLMAGDGKVIGAIQSIRDISERKRAEERLRLMAESIQDVFWIVTPRFEKISYINPAYEEIWGRSRQSLYEDPLSFLETGVHPDDLRGVLEQISTISEPGANFDAEYRIIRPDGSIRWVRNRACPIRDEQGNLRILTGVARDITDRRKTEETLRKSEAELRFLSSKLLTAHEEERKRIAAELHDSLGSYLAAIKFSLENTINDFKKGEADIDSFNGTVSLIQTAMEDLRRIIMDLRPTILDDLGLIATLEWFCRNFKLIYCKIRVVQRISVTESDIPEDLKIVIFRLLQESFHNIAKYSRADLVRLSLARKSDKLELTITDNGEGFNVVSALSKASSSRGLGLSSMRERTELAGGLFSIASAPGRGTEIHACWNLRLQKV